MTRREIKQNFIRYGIFSQGFNSHTHQTIGKIFNLFWFTSTKLFICTTQNYGQRFVTFYRRQWSRPSPRKRNAKKAKWFSEKALQIAEKRRETKSKREKQRYTHLNAEFLRIAWRDKKAFLSDQCKEIEGNNRMGKTSDLFRKLEILREHFMQRWAP